MSAIGFTAVNKMFQNAIPGPVEPWHTFTNTEYAAYVELGTTRMEGRPYMRNATDKAYSEIDELTKKAASLNALIRLIALRIESHSKKNCVAMFRTPAQGGTSLGNLMRSITAEKV